MGTFSYTLKCKLQPLNCLTLIGTEGGADIVNLTIFATTDVITDFTSGTGGDQIAITLFLNTIVGSDGADVIAATATQVNLITGQETLAAGDNVFVLSGTFATVALAGAALEAGGGRQITATAAQFDTGDVIVFVYTDGTDTHVVQGTLTNLVAATTIDAGGLAEVTIATLSGVTDMTALVSTNFDFIA
jgi:hypothetical protein